MHTYLAIPTHLIPQSTKDNTANYDLGLFSNDGVYLLIDGRNEYGNLVHPMAVLKAWLGTAENKDDIILNILANSTEYTKEEFILLKADPTSIWWVE